MSDLILCLVLALLPGQTRTSLLRTHHLPLTATKQLDRSTPEATVRSFFNTFMQYDLKSAASCVDGVPYVPLHAALAKQLRAQE